MGPYSESLSKSCSLLQDSHWALARNNLDQAKTDALAACNTINKLLENPDNSLQHIRSLAQYALEYYARLLEKRSAALSAQEKFGWLTSTPAATGGFWFPTLTFGDVSSADIAPLEASDTSVKVPDFGEQHPVEFREVQGEIVASMKTLSIVQPEPLSGPQARCSSKQTTGSSANSLNTLYQDVLSDCSFVSSLLSISELKLTANLRDLVTIFDNGTAKVRLFINGFWREVAVTTKLPHFKFAEERSLFVRCAETGPLLWPALLEKAYVTAFPGHYAFGGSNMANDTYMLTGWIPEIRMMNKMSPESLEELWHLKTCGTLLMGLGTGTISPALEENLGIISNHDYVLSAYDEKRGLYSLTNPWAFRHNDDKKAQRLLVVDRSLFCHFKYLYLNWKPQSKHELRTYFLHSPSQWPSKFLGDKPQFHFCNRTNKTQEISILVEQFQGQDSDFCVSVWQDAKNIVYTFKQYYCVSGGKFVNSKHYLIKLNLAPFQDHVVSILSKHTKTSKFALTVYHDMEDFLFGRAKSSYDHTLPLMSGHWGQEKAGGNWSNETFINNPQYDFEMRGSPSIQNHASSRLMVALACANESLDINVHLVHCSPEERGRRIRKFDPSRLVFNEKYTNQLFLHQVEDVQPGHYKLLVSTYNPGEVGDFNLLLAHDGEGPLQVVPTPHSLGTFIKDVSFEWKMANRKKLEICTSHNKTQMTLHLRSGETDAQKMSNYRPAIRASVFDALTRKPVIVTSEWSDSVYGVFLDCCLMDSDRSYILLVERFETGEGTCRISVGSSHRASIQELAQG
ncbi:hypothetical protein JCM33374_g941 [Metschnikowia sp. JCM 33374]|nr:hypothetical protein JCM33374_g941 [Metschnikowia sp. JCM 33374]